LGHEIDEIRHRFEQLPGPDDRFSHFTRSTRRLMDVVRSLLYGSACVGSDFRGALFYAGGGTCNFLNPAQQTKAITGRADKVSQPPSSQTIRTQPWQGSEPFGHRDVAR
jgi:hypothetical protein